MLPQIKLMQAVGRVFPGHSGQHKHGSSTHKKGGGVAWSNLLAQKLSSWKELSQKVCVCVHGFPAFPSQRSSALRCFRHQPPWRTRMTATCQAPQVTGARPGRCRQVSAVPGRQRSNKQCVHPQPKRHYTNNQAIRLQGTIWKPRRGVIFRHSYFAEQLLLLPTLVDTHLPDSRSKSLSSIPAQGVLGSACNLTCWCIFWRGWSKAFMLFFKSTGITQTISTGAREPGDRREEGHKGAAYVWHRENGSETALTRDACFPLSCSGYTGTCARR